MLSDAHRSLYLNLQQTLVQLQPLVQLQQTQEKTQKHRDIEKFAVESAFQAVQRSFQQVLALDWEQIDPTIVSYVQSYQTEINRQFRLLKMDMMYLQAARQAATADQRRQQINDRIESLIQYCEALLRSEKSTE